MSKATQLVDANAGIRILVSPGLELTGPRTPRTHCGWNASSCLEFGSPCVPALCGEACLTVDRWLLGVRLASGSQAVITIAVEWNGL